MLLICVHFSHCFCFVAFVELEDIQAAIAVATCKLGLQPGCTFQSRVFQLAQLVGTHKVVSRNKQEWSIPILPYTEFEIYFL